MQQHVVTAAVPAEPPEVFRYLTEPALLPRWIDGLRESRPQGDGVMRVGAKSIEVVEARGKLVEMVSEVTAFDVDRALSVRVTYPGAGDAQDLRVDSGDSRDRIAAHIHAALPRSCSASRAVHASVNAEATARHPRSAGTGCPREQP